MGYEEKRKYAKKGGEIVSCPYAVHRMCVDLRKRAKSDLTIGITFLVYPLNYLGICEAAHLAKKLGVDYIQIRPVFIPGKKPLIKIWYTVKQLKEKSKELIDDKFHVFPILRRFDEVAKV